MSEKFPNISPVPEWVKKSPEWQKKTETEATTFNKSQPAQRDKLRTEKLPPIRSFEEKEERELEDLVKEFKNGLEHGKVAYNIHTKIPAETSYRGYTETSKANKDVEPYCTYSVGKEGDNAVKAPLGIDTTGWGWEEFGDVLVVSSPIKKGVETLKTVTEEKRKFFGGTKNVKVQKTVKEYVPVTLSDFGIHEKTDEALRCLKIQYRIDTSKFLDKRRNFTQINFALPELLARNIAEKVTEKPEKLWQFLKSIEPDLMDLDPPRKDALGDPTPFAVVAYNLDTDRPNSLTVKPNKIVDRKDKF